jgi:hypothetical protein
MIKATGRTADGDTLLLLGLSRLNARWLLRGQPIRVNGIDVGLPGLQVLIVGGETEDAITAELTKLGLVGPATPAEDQGELRSERDLS